MSKRVAILMATYNGEKYIGEQIKSILNQDYYNFELFIRDDCSTDNTVEEIEKFHDKRIILIKGEKNLGYPAGFYQLFKEGIQADYYAFADQDDVWVKNKISKAIECLEKESNRIPLAYYGGYHICDEKLNILRESIDIKKELTFKDTLFEVPGLEFTMVFNKNAYQLWKDNMPEKCKARGTWGCMLISAFGKIKIDNSKVAFYRRHEKSVTSKNIGSIKQWRERTKVFFGGGFNQYKLVLNDFYHVIGEQLNDNCKKTLETFVGRHYFKKVFYPKRLRRKKQEDFMLRIVFLMRKL